MEMTILITTVFEYPNLGIIKETHREFDNLTDAEKEYAMLSEQSKKSHGHMECSAKLLIKEDKMKKRNLNLVSYNETELQRSVDDEMLYDFKK